MYLSRSIKFRALLFSLSILFAGAGQSQSVVEAGPHAPNMSLDNLVQGRLYVKDYYPINGSPYLDESWTLGSVFLLDNQYPDLFLRYDLFSDLLVLLHRSGNGFDKIQLNKEYIRHFTLEDRFFINLNFSRYKSSGLKEGYYEIIFEDKISLLAKRALDIETRDALTYFHPNNIWYVVKDGLAYRIRNKKDLVEVFGSDDKKSISTFIKKQGIRFKKAGDAEWKQLAAYLNTLYNQANL